MEARESKRASMSYRLALINSWVLLAHLPTMVVDLDWETDYELTVAEDITKACFWACLGGAMHRHLSSGKATKGLQCELLHPIPKGTEAEEQTCHHRPCSLSAKRGLLPHAAASIMLLPFLRPTAESVRLPQGFPFVNSYKEERFRSGNRKG